MGNPWEIVRNDISYPIKFYGKVVKGSDGKKRWIGGEDIVAVANDIPIPGYKTKTTINLRLWDTKVPPSDFDLSAFNSGDHTKACETQANAEKVDEIICTFHMFYMVLNIDLKFKYIFIYFLPPDMLYIISRG